MDVKEQPQELQTLKEELAKTKEDLEKANAELKMLSHTVLGGVARLDLNDGLRIITASDGYYRMIGYTEEESHKPPFCDRGINLVVPDDVPQIYETLKKLEAGNAPASVSYRCRRKDGSISWNTAYCSRIEEHCGRRYIDVFFMDATDIMETREQLVALINGIPSGVVTSSVSDDITIRYANNQFYAQIGYSREEFGRPPISNHYLPIVHPEDRDNVLTYVHAFYSNSRKTASIDYRIIRKDGAVRWVRSKASKINDEFDARSILQSIITDITDDVEQRRKNMIQEERYRIISEQTRDTVFDWDLNTNKIQFSPVYKKMFGFMPPEYVTISNLLDADIIYEDDKPTVQKMIDDVTRGVPYAEAEYRAKCADGSYIWCRNRLTTIYDDRRRPVNAIGILTDIDHYKIENQLLREQAMRDSMTMLYNRMTIEIKVRELISESFPDETHAFFLFDIDRFKQINDCFGHKTGDIVLKQVAECLKRLPFDDYIFGRMGGDEFALINRHIKTVGDACQRADLLKDSIRQYASDDKDGYTVTVSIGISIYPEHGYTFQELYEHADIALYQAKACGGNTLVLYSPAQE